MSTSAGESMQILRFELDVQQFAFNVLNTREVLFLETITPLPNAADFLAGLINLRGAVVPVLDLRKKLALRVSPATENTAIIIVEFYIEGELTLMGVLVDQVFGVMHVSKEIMEAPPKVGLKLNKELIRAIVKRENAFVVVLDAERLLAGNEIWQFQDAALAGA